jgi:uncharacterized coiled-coil DUF342 family protein
MFKNLKSIFIEEDEESGKKGTPTPPPQKREPADDSPPPQAKVHESKEGEPGRVTQKFTEILLRAMEANNLDGFDYLEFKQSLKSLEKMPMDEQTRFQSAFAMAQTLGATPEKLVQTAQHYIQVLQKEENKFEEALTNQRTKQIGSKTQEISKLEENIKAKAAQIKKLTQEIEANQKRSEALKTEIKEATQKVDSTKNNFIASYNALIEKISGDIEKMGKYLK